ncbi:Lactate-binding periplasmic protein [subsurface metagenome]
MPPEEMLTGIGAGLAEAGEGAANYWAGIEPALDLSFGLPMMGRSPIGDVMAFQNLGPWSEETRRIFADNDCHFVGWHTYGPYPVLCSRVPVYGISDWKGVKVRISGYNAALLEAMDASTTYIPGAEIAEALTMGTIDVGTWSAECILDMGFGEVMDYLIMPPFMDHMGGVTFVNQEAWNALPEEYKEYVEEAERMAAWKSHRFYNKYMADDINLATGAGTPGPYGYDVIYFSDEDIAEMARLAEEVVWSDWAKTSPLCAKGIEIAKEWYGPVFRM